MKLSREHTSTKVQQKSIKHNNIYQLIDISPLNVLHCFHQEPEKMVKIARNGNAKLKKVKNKSWIQTKI